MTPVLYVETNFVLDIAKSETNAARKLLEEAEAGRLELRLPTVCIMESYKAWQNERRRVIPVIEEIADRLPQIKGWRGQTVMESTVAGFREGLIEVDRELHEIRAEIACTIERILAVGSLLPLPDAWPKGRKSTILIEDEPDDMILHSVLMEAARSGTHAAFLTKNTKDFQTRAVTAVADAVNLKMLFQPEHAFGWAFHRTLGDEQ